MEVEGDSVSVGKLAITLSATPTLGEIFLFPGVQREVPD